MRRQSVVQTVAAVAALLASTACASSPNPWRAHDRAADTKLLLSDAERGCPVVVLNGTGQVLEALVALHGVDRSLGLLADGQSTVVTVACGERRVQAKGIAQTPGLAEAIRFSKTAVLDVTRETSLRLTSADRARW
jgi:hypothetical protein